MLTTDTTEDNLLDCKQSRAEQSIKESILISSLWRQRERERERERWPGLPGVKQINRLDWREEEEEVTPGQVTAISAA